VGDLVVGVVVDVLRHVRVQNRQRRRVRGVSGPAWDFVVLDGAELVVLLPEIGLESLEGRRDRRSASSPLDSLLRAEASGTSANSPAPSAAAPAPARNDLLLVARVEASLLICSSLGLGMTTGAQAQPTPSSLDCSARLGGSST
jgi:hypothetical protein